MSASVSTLGDSGWLIHIQNVLAGSAWIAARVALESASVLIHCRLLSCHNLNVLFFNSINNLTIQSQVIWSRRNITTLLTHFHIV